MEGALRRGVAPVEREERRQLRVNDGVVRAAELGQREHEPLDELAPHPRPARVVVLRRGGGGGGGRVAAGGAREALTEDKRRLGALCLRLDE